MILCRESLIPEISDTKTYNVIVTDKKGHRYVFEADQVVFSVGSAPDLRKAVVRQYEKAWARPACDAYPAASRPGGMLL